MPPFKFTQANWKQFFLFSIISFLLFRIFQNYFGFGGAGLITLVLAIPILLWLVKYFQAVVVFKDSQLVYKKGFFAKKVTINYSDIKGLTYSNDRFQDFHLNTAKEKIKLPTPGKLEIAHKLFGWLKTRNPEIEMKVLEFKSA